MTKDKQLGSLNDNNYHLDLNMLGLRLSDLKPGEWAMVDRFSHPMSSECRKLLQNLGLLPKILIKLVRKAPLGDPLQVEFLGSQISLRGSEAQHIYIKRISGNASQ